MSTETPAGPCGKENNQGHLTAYELSRLQRIRENEQVLISMGLQDAAQNLSSSFKRPAKAPSQSSTATPKKDPPPASRRSLRIQGVKVEVTELVAVQPEDHRYKEAMLNSSDSVHVVQTAPVCRLL